MAAHTGTARSLGDTFFPDEFGYTRTFCTSAASNGNLGVLKWLRLQSSAWDAQTCSEAAQNGHLEVLQWLRRQSPPCPWDPDRILHEIRFSDPANYEEIKAWVQQEIATAGMADLVL